MSDAKKFIKESQKFLGNKKHIDEVSIMGINNRISINLDNIGSFISSLPELEERIRFASTDLSTDAQVIKFDKSIQDLYKQLDGVTKFMMKLG